jgi:HTH-type transcriptional regulator / antitoxin HipB
MKNTLKLNENFPFSNTNAWTTPVRSSEELGAYVRAQRKLLGLKQLEVAGLGNTGNRFIIELESGKPTLQLQKVLDIIDLLGLELTVRPKAKR